MGKRVGIFIVFFIFFLFCNKHQAFANNYLNIFDIKKVEVQGLSYIGYVSQTGIYILDEQGNEIKHFKMMIDDELIKKNNIHFEMVKDLDEKGYNDLLLVITDAYDYNQSSVTLISYEDESILWEYDHYMENKNYCQFGNCIEKTYLTDYFIDQHFLYLTGGYSLIKINLETKVEVKRYNYHNNIWAISQIGDLNGDEVKEWVISVQPAKIITIDGTDFTPLTELKVIDDITFDGKTIQLNIYDLLYKEKEEVLLAIGENGISYEINPHLSKIVKKNQITTLDETIIHAFFSKGNSGYQSKTYKNGRILNGLGNSLYVVMFDDSVFNPNLTHPTFKVCSVSESCKNYEGHQYVSFNNNYLLTIIDDDIRFKILRIENVVTKEVNTKLSFPNIFYIDETEYIYFSPYNFTVYNQGKEVFTKVTKPKYISVQFEEYLMVLKGDENKFYQLTLLNPKGDAVYSYYGHSVTDYAIDGDLLYTIEQDEEGYHVKLHDLKEKKIIKETSFGNKDKKKLVFAKLYDLNKVVLIFETYEHYQYTIELVTYDLYQHETNQLAEYINDEPVVFIEVIDDLNNDTIKEILIVNEDNKAYSWWYRERDYYLHISKTNELYPFQIESLDMTNSDSHLKLVTDLNNDGYKEVIFEQSFGYGNKFETRKVIIVDYKNNQMHHVNKPNESYHRLLNTIDINHDGINEFITLSYEILNPCLYDAKCGDSQFFKYKLNIYTYENNTLRLVQDLYFVSKNAFHPYLETFNSLIDYNHDSFMDLVFFDFDDYGHINYNIYDIHNQLLTRDIVNVFDKHKRGITDEHTRHINGDLQKVTINNQSYFLVKYDHYYLINETTLAVDFILDEMLDLYHNQLVSVRGNYIHTNNPFSVEVHKSINNNQLNLNIQGIENIKKLHVFINDQLIDSIYHEEKLKLILDEGVSHIFVEIHTSEGIYYYSDRIKIEKQTNYLSIGLISSLVSIITLATVFSKKYYYN